MDVMYAIFKVYVSERNDVIKRHNNVIAIWRTSAIEITALLKSLCTKNESCAKKKKINKKKKKKKINKSINGERGR